MALSMLNWLHIKQQNHTLFKFIAYSFLLTFTILLAFVFRAGSSESMLGLAYSLTIPLYYYLIILFLTLLVLPLFWSSKLLPLIILPKLFIDLLLLGDFFLFGVYRFHLDMMFINMVIFDFQGLGLSGWIILLSSVVALFVLAMHVLLFKKLDRLPDIQFKKLNLALFVVFILGQLGHVVGYEYKQVAITKYTPYLPYYAPMTSSSLMNKLKAKFPDVFPQKSEAPEDQVADILANDSSGLMQYPLNPLECKADTKPNVLVFVLESWRQDSWAEDYTPNFFQFAQGATEFSNHYSGGSVTVNGLFSLMYGLHPTYRDHLTANPYKNQSLLTRTLAEQGYDIDVYTSSNLDRFSLKAMFFGKIADENYINPTQDKTDVDDRNAVDALLKDLQTPSGKPWFKFVFLSSSHHAYDYPEQHKMFTPIETNPEAFLFDRDMDNTKLVNDYKNSLNYLDSMFGEIWQVMEQTGQISNTLSMVTSDHGEEFNDNKLGYWGHGNNFSQYQVAVPMLVKAPGQTEKAQVSQLSGHIDVVPTILQNATKCMNPSSDYSSGFDLFNLPEKRNGMIAASYKDKAYIIDEKVYATGLTVESYDIKDLKQTNEDFEFGKLNKLKGEETAFLK